MSVHNLPGNRPANPKRADRHIRIERLDGAVEWAVQFGCHAEKLYEHTFDINGSSGLRSALRYRSGTRSVTLPVVHRPFSRSGRIRAEGQRDVVRQRATPSKVASAP